MADDETKRRDKTTSDGEDSDEETESRMASSDAENDDQRDDEDEDDEDDEDEDEDEDDDHSASAENGAEEEELSADDDWIPDWAPWAVLIAIVAAGLAGLLGFLSPEKPTTTAATAAPASTTEVHQDRQAKPERREAAQQRAEGSDAGLQRVSARHLLVQYKGSMRAKESITRSKEEAKRRAEAALAKARKGEDFVKLVKEYSDEPGADTRGGMLRKFTRRQMVKPFSDAAFALRPGEVSGVVETKFGYHVIKRLD